MGLSNVLKMNLSNIYSNDIEHNKKKYMELESVPLSSEGLRPLLLRNSTKTTTSFDILKDCQVKYRYIVVNYVQCYVPDEWKPTKICRSLMPRITFVQILEKQNFTFKNETLWKLCKMEILNWEEVQKLPCLQDSGLAIDESELYKLKNILVADKNRLMHAVNNKFLF
jgi:hypothetical protein